MSFNFDRYTDYKTARSATSEGLDQEVLQLIAEGYQPYSSPYAVNGMYCQAMVR